MAHAATSPVSGSRQPSRSTPPRPSPLNTMPTPSSLPRSVRVRAASNVPQDLGLTTDAYLLVLGSMGTLSSLTSAHATHRRVPARSSTMAAGHVASAPTGDTMSRVLAWTGPADVVNCSDDTESAFEGAPVGCKPNRVAVVLSLKIRAQLLGSN